MNSRILTVIGARPQFIKASPLSAALRRMAGIHEIIVHTGQHYDRMMSDVFFDELNLPTPDYNLEIGSASHGAQTGRMIEKLEQVMIREKPQLAVVFGDTNSTLAGALAAAKLLIPVAHVEAGMRCGDRSMPEEINRTTTDRISSLFFCPTRTAVRNLEHEGITDNVHMTGDVMADSFLQLQTAAVDKSGVLAREKLKPGEFILLTVHRAENTKSETSLGAILEGCSGSRMPVLFPVHPRTRKILDKVTDRPENIRLAEPVSYIDMLALESQAFMILTDSGGMQKEAYLAGTPCVTLRETTEWPETVESGWNLLVGTKSESIHSAIMKFRPESTRSNIFGNGNAARKIADIICRFTSL